MSSYAYAACTFEFTLDYELHLFESNTLTFGASAKMNLNVQFQPVLSFPSSASLTGIALYPRDSSWIPYPAFAPTLSIAGVPLTLSLSGKFEMDVNLITDDAVELSPGGVTTSSSWVRLSCSTYCVVYLPR